MKPKVTVTPHYWRDCYTVSLTIGVQTFTFNYSGTKEDCQYYARMVRKALKNIGRKA